MYHHVKKLSSPSDEPDPRFGNMLLEQFGGANGEPRCNIRSRASIAKTLTAKIF